MVIKQAVFDGDRSHPSIVALDKTRFSYKGCELDVEDAMARIIGDCSLFCLGEFEPKLKEMERKQQAHEDRTQVQELQYLEGLQFTYEGWEVDKKCAERLYLEYDCSSTAKRPFSRKRWQE